MSETSTAELVKRGKAGGYRWLEIAFDCWEHKFEHAFHHGDTPPRFDTSATWNTRQIIDLSLPFAGDTGYADLDA